MIKKSFALILTLLVSFIPLHSVALANNLAVKNEKVIQLQKCDLMYAFDFKEENNQLFNSSSPIIKNDTPNYSWAINLLIPGMTQLLNGFNNEGITQLFLAFISATVIVISTSLGNNFISQFLIYILGATVFIGNYSVSLYDSIEIVNNRKIKR